MPTSDVRIIILAQSETGLPGEKTICPATMYQVILQLEEKDIFSRSQVKTIKGRYSSFLSDVSQNIL
jgi:hypothetical protein